MVQAEYLSPEGLQAAIDLERKKADECLSEVVNRPCSEVEIVRLRRQASQHIQTALELETVLAEKTSQAYECQYFAD